MNFVCQQSPHTSVAHIRVRPLNRLLFASNPSAKNNLVCTYFVCNILTQALENTRNLADMCHASPISHRATVQKSISFLFLPCFSTFITLPVWNVFVNWSNLDAPRFRLTHVHLTLAIKQLEKTKKKKIKTKECYIYHDSRLDCIFFLVFFTFLVFFHIHQTIFVCS